MTIEKLDEILLVLNYYDNFKNNYLYKTYKEIDYGKQIGRLKFNSFFDAAENYKYSEKLGEEVFKQWNLTLTNEESTDEEIFITSLEIFDWGNVHKGNIKASINLHKSKELKPYITKCKNLLKRKTTIEKVKNAKITTDSNIDVIWSSGWTKVYSFLDTNILIYDSRVSAFLNHTLTYNLNYTNEQTEVLLNLTKNLYNFGGVADRERLVDKKFGFKKQHPSELGGFNANLISSWIIKLLKEKLQLDQDYRSFERAFFMLGFDLKQIKD